MTPAYKRQRLAQLDSNAEMEQRLSEAACNMLGVRSSDSKRNVRSSFQPADTNGPPVPSSSPAAANNGDLCLPQKSMKFEPWEVEPTFWSPDPSLFNISSSKAVLSCPSTDFDEAVLTDGTILPTPASITEHDAVHHTFKRVVNYDLVELAKQLDSLRPVGNEASFATLSLSTEDDDDAVEHDSMDLSSFLWSECGGVRTLLEPWEVDDAWEKEFEEPTHLPLLLHSSWKEDSVNQLGSLGYTGELLESPPLQRDIFDRVDTERGTRRDQTGVTGTLEPIDVNSIWGISSQPVDFTVGGSGDWDLDQDDAVA